MKLHNNTLKPYNIIVYRSVGVIKKIKHENKNVCVRPIPE